MKKAILVTLFVLISAGCHAQAVISGNVAMGGSSGTSSPSVTFNVLTGVNATPAAPFILARSNGLITHCYFTTLTSDPGTNLVFNVKFNGANIISGTNATVTAATASGTISTFSLTSSSITITSGQKWELDISGGSALWTGAVQCF